MKNTKKRILSLLLTAALVISLMPGLTLTARAVTCGGFEVTGGTDYSYSGSVLTFSGDGTYTVAMASGVTSTADTIVVSSGTVNITLSAVNVSTSGCAFSIGSGSTVNLTLSGTNTLASGSGYAGIQVPSGAALTITTGGNVDSDGTLSATGGDGGAGIGGGTGSDGGTVSIVNGTVTAVGGGSAKGIGCGYGYGGSNCNIIISNGSVNANLSGPAYKSSAKSTEVYMTTTTGLAKSHAYICCINNEDEFISRTDSSGCLYFWMPYGTGEMYAYNEADSSFYIASGAVSTDNSSTFTASLEYTVSFDTGSGDAVTSQDVLSGGYATKPTTDPTYTDYVFEGWYTDNTYATKFAFTTTAITAATTIYAKWIASALTSIGDIKGTAMVGQTLTAGAVDPDVAVTYQWTSASDPTSAGAPISGATGNTYTLVAADVDKYIRVVATADATGYTGSVTSAATDAVAASIASALSAINAAANDATGMGTAITDNATTLGLVLTDYNALTDKTPVYTALYNQGFTSAAAVKTAFDSAVATEKSAEASAAAITTALSAINGAANSAEGMGAAITTYATTLGLTLTDYDALTDKTPVYTALYNQGFTSAAAVKTAFDSAVATEKSAETVSTDATLSTLTTSAGTLSPAFDSATTTYSVMLPYGTTAVPTVTPSVNESHATTVVSYAASLPGATTVTVTAQDGMTKTVYTINYTVSLSNAASYSFNVSEGNITISAGSDTGHLKVTYGSVQTTTDDILYSQELTITGSSSSYGVTVNGSLPYAVNVLLEAVNISASGCAFSVGSGTTVNLTLSGSNILKSGSNKAGLQVPSGATLYINKNSSDTDDSLTATGGYLSAGIGGTTTSSISCGTVDINGGTIIATGGIGGAGIGGANSGSSVVNIYGGIVQATGTSGGAGIGGNNGWDGCSVAIKGGYVTAIVSAGSAASIGRGHGGRIGSLAITGGSVLLKNGTSDTPTDGNGHTVYLVTVTGLPASTAVIYTVDGSANSITTFTDSNGELYLWLPYTDSSTSILITQGAKTYHSSGTVAQDDSNSFPVYYTVSFNTGSGSVVTGQNVVPNNFATEPATDPTYDGHAFKGWYTDNTYATEFSFGTMAITADTIIYAKWADAYSVSFDTGSGSTVNSQTIESGDYATEPATDPTYDGHVFKGWYTDNTYATEFNFGTMPITATTTIYAKWTAIYAVSFSTGSGTVVTGQTVESGSYATEPATDPTYDGHIFKGWYTDNTYATEFSFSTLPITAATTIYAKWTAIYAVSFNTGSGSTATGQTVESDGYATKPATDPTYDGYVFKGWYADNTYATEFNFGTMPITAATTIYAKWTAIYAVSFSTGSGSSVDSLTVESGSYATKPVTDPTYDGHVFKGWYTDNTYATEFSFSTMPITATTTIYAKWADAYTVSFNTGSGTAVTGQTVESDGYATKPATDPTYDGHVFKGWYTDNTYKTEFNFSATAITADTVIYAKWADAYTVSFNTGFGSSVTSQSVASGGYATKPTDPTYSGYTFSGWYTDSNYSTTFDFINTAITANTVIYAKWTANSSGGGSSGGTTTTDTTNTATTSTADGTTTAKTDVKTTTGTDGTSTASVNEEQITNAVKAATEEATKQSTKAVVEISVATGTSATGVTVTIPRNSVQAAANSSIDALKISSSVVSVTFDGTALDTISKNATGDIMVKAVPADSTALSDSNKALIGDRPVYDLSISSASTTISSFGGGKATVSIPYTLKSGEDANKIVIYYISGSGELVTVPDCVYNASTGTVTFTTTHFSNYAVGYNNVSFTDVSGWYTDYVSYLAARGIIGGTGDGKFSPDANITRAEFVTILARMSGDELSGYTSSSFSDVATTDWYFAAVQWAYKNGVAAGSDGKFNPNATITRQDIAVMLARYADKVASYTLPKTNSAVTFTDNAKISSYASDAVTAMQQAGIISGNSDGCFAPTANATRAEAAKMIALLIRISVN